MNKSEKKIFSSRDICNEFIEQQSSRHSKSFRSKKTLAISNKLQQIHRAVYSTQLSHLCHDVDRVSSANQRGCFSPSTERTSSLLQVIVRRRAHQRAARSGVNWPRVEKKFFRFLCFHRLNKRNFPLSITNSIKCIWIRTECAATR